MMIAQMRPMTQDRRVPTGMSGSSVLATAERTSGYGESSSRMPAIAASLSMSKQERKKHVVSNSTQRNQKRHKLGSYVPNESVGGTIMEDDQETYIEFSNGEGIDKVATRAFLGIELVNIDRARALGLGDIGDRLGLHHDDGSGGGGWGDG